MARTDEDSESNVSSDVFTAESPLTSRLLVAFQSFGHRELIVVALGIGGTPFVVGLLIALGGGFGPAYLTTGTVYLWTFGLFGGGLTFGWWAKRYPELWRKLEPVFDVPEDEYRTRIRPRIGRMYNLGRPLLWFPVVLALATIYDWVLVGVRFLVYVPESIPADVSAAGPLVTCPLGYCITWLSVVNYAFGVVSLVGLLIAIHVVFTHLRLVGDVMDLPLRDVGTAAADLTPLARFNTVISAGWFVSLTLGIVLFTVGRPTKRLSESIWQDPLLGSGLLFVTLFGFVLFAVPQYSIHGALASEKQALLDEIDAEYDGLYEDVATTDAAATSFEQVSVQLDVLDARRRGVKEISTWAYDLPGLTSLLLTSGLPLFLQFVQMFGG